MSQHPARTILIVHSGADHPQSITRMLADELLTKLAGAHDTVVHRTALEGLPVVTGAWVAASFTDGDKQALAFSDVLVDELLAADELILVSPIYNFGDPPRDEGIDRPDRPGRSHSRFGPTGVEGLTTIQRAWIVTIGDTPVGSEADFNTTYLAAILQFIGVPHVEVITAASSGLTLRPRSVAGRLLSTWHLRPDPTRQSASATGWTETARRPTRPDPRLRHGGPRPRARRLGQRRSGEPLTATR